MVIKKKVQELTKKHLPNKKKLRKFAGVYRIIAHKEDNCNGRIRHRIAPFGLFSIKKSVA